ncbi:MAG: hypothetical protein M3Z85_13625, partial [Acidobacteriota bacterium]|nr:hypothetical protein [Acidobacteriota bacterium]
VHQAIPELPPVETNIYMGPDLKNDLPGKPGPAPGAGATGRTAPLTDADRALEHYKAVGAQQGHQFGNGRKPPDFNIKPAPQSAVPQP